VTAAPAIEVYQLTKVYPAPWRLSLQRRAPGRPALEGLSFSVEPGHVAALIGPNGSGKSTLLRILSGVLLPTEGWARVAGRDVVGDRPHSRAAVGVALADERGLSTRLSVAENLRFFGALYGLGPTQTRERVSALAERLECVSLLERPVRTLSHGERARAALLRALLHEPAVLLVDELTRSLDPGAARRIRTWLRDACSSAGRALLLATHDLAEVEALATDVVLLEGGRLVARGPWSATRAAAEAVFARHGGDAA
jgi:ABC-type multidrug transport system ATPase subunit